MTRFVKTLGLALAVGMCLTLAAGPATAGSIVMTGHDDDFHFSGFSGSSTQLAAMMTYARDPSRGAPAALPVLVFDSNAPGASGGGYQLAARLTTLGIPHVMVDLNASLYGSSAAFLAAIPGGFSPTTYSAIAIASVSTCGGCDIRVGDINTLLTPHSAAIAAFFNAGGGIMQQTGATDATAYAYLPATAGSPSGFPPSSGYVATLDGIAAGIGPVNGDATHNFFAEPGTGGVDPDFLVFERLGSPTSGTPVTIGLRGSIDDGGFTGVPVPAGMALAVSGLLSLGGFSIRRRKATV